MHMPIPNTVLQQVEGHALFYPCSGNDLEAPIHTFSPYITDYWFVDIGYFSPGHGSTYEYGGDQPADVTAPCLEGHPGYDLLSVTVRGIPEWDTSDRDISPCVRTETYLHRTSDREIRIHRRRGYGYSAFRKESFSLGVFFYRNDSAGEGGSGNLWLTPQRINMICGKLINGGLIVTDGSNHGGNQQHSPIWTYPCQIGQERADTSDCFTDRSGRTFVFVGQLDLRYGETLVWQVWQPEPSTRKEP